MSNDAKSPIGIENVSVPGLFGLLVVGSPGILTGGVAVTRWARVQLAPSFETSTVTFVQSGAAPLAYNVMSGPALSTTRVLGVVAMLCPSVSSHSGVPEVKLVMYSGTFGYGLKGALEPLPGVSRPASNVGLPLR